ncbi:MAG: type II secretion system protein J, partial [Phycisphaerae bacterium]
RRSTRRALAFSLLEMMIAIVILGLGLILVATMFPVAWNRARSLTEYTTQVAVTEAAHNTVELLTRVDTLQEPPPPALPDAGSFAGDLITRGLDPDGLPIDIVSYSDTRVHALHLENLLADSQGFVPARVDNPEDFPWATGHFPWKLERIALPDQTTNIAGLGLDPEGACFIGPCEPLLSMFFNAQVRFGERLYPPMPEQLKPFDELWYEVLGNRRYAWAVFHRLPKPTWPNDPSPPPDREGRCNFDDPATSVPVAAAKSVNSTRTFVMYYVTLKRPQPALRYARQDTDPAKTPEFDWLLPGVDWPVGGREVPKEPAALPPEYDVVLPSPWRVQVLFPNTLASRTDGNNPPTNIPTEIKVNPKAAPTAGFVVDMFQEGTQCIDELNGQIYRITQRRLLGRELDEAVLTLDREILIEDINDGYCFADPLTEDHPSNNTLEPEELLRTVWVFPPPVQAQRSGGAPVFTGNQPVVSIETRTLQRSPRR